MVAVKQWSIVLLGWIFSLPLSNIVGVGKVLVEMSLELLVFDESHTTIRALKLNTFMQLRNCDNVESTKSWLIMKMNLLFQGHRI